MLESKFLNRPWPVIADHLHKKYQVVCEIDFLALDHDPHLMFAKLQAAYKDEYQPNEKIVVYHYDTDYYVENTGFCLHNFLRCLKRLNISPSVVVMFTNHHGISKEIENFYSTNYSDFDYKNDHMFIFESNHMIQQTTSDPLPTNLDIDQISHPYSCLFGAKRTHRVMLLSQLQQHKILNKGICAWNATVTYPPLDTEESNNVTSNDNFAPEFLTTSKFTRINEHWAQSQELIAGYHQFGHLYDAPYKHPAIVGINNQNKFEQPALKKTFLNVSVETVFKYPYPFVTEKTFRPILHKRPFVIVGAPHSLKFLRSIGFKTFDKFWDESYDNIENPDLRMKAVVDIVKQISNTPVAQLQELCYNMKTVLEYNFDHYVNCYSKTDLLDKLKLI